MGICLEQFTNETSELLCEDLFADPRRETGAGGRRPAVSELFHASIAIERFTFLATAMQILGHRPIGDVLFRKSFATL
jgi:hypothetical protein